MHYVLFLGAVISTFILGFLWYGPMMFHKVWCRENGVPEDFQAGHPAKVFGLSFIFASITAAAFAHMIGYSDDVLMSTVHGGAAGAAFAACSFGVNYQFAGRSFKLLLIDGGYHTIQFALYGAIFSAFHEMV